MTQRHKDMVFIQNPWKTEQQKARGEDPRWEIWERKKLSMGKLVPFHWQRSSNRLWCCAGMHLAWCRNWWGLAWFVCLLVVGVQGCLGRGREAQRYLGWWWMRFVLCLLKLELWGLGIQVYGSTIRFHGRDMG